MAFNRVEIGTDVYEDDLILEGNCYISNGIIAEELGIDTFDIEIISESKPSYPYGSSVAYYHSGALIGKFYLESITRIGKTAYKLYCISAVGLLDKQTHYGGVYTGQTAREVAADIIGGAISYTIQTKVGNTKVYGWLPVASKRENLHQLLFALGAEIKKDTAGTVQIAYLSAKSPKEIPDSRIGIDGEIEYIDEVTGVSVTEHAFIKTANDETITLFEGVVQDAVVTSPKGQAFTGALITFEEPVYDLSLSSGSILESGDNYAVISSGGQAALTGKKYTHTMQDVSVSIDGAAGAENIVRVENCTLVNLTNSQTTAERIADYYSKTHYINIDMEVGEERPGDAVKLSDPFDEPAEGLLESQDINLSNTLLAETTIAVGYKPSSGPVIYNASVILTGEGEWVCPSEQFRAVLIGGGGRGEDGYSGKGSTAITGKYNYSDKSFHVSPGSSASVNTSASTSGSSSGGAGGAGGAGGVSGRIFQKEFVAQIGDTFSYSCGIAGDVYGSPGSDTVFGDFSSADGDTSANGYTDVITGSIYAFPGKAGNAGGAGGDARERGEAVGDVLGGGYENSFNSNVSASGYTGELSPGYYSFPIKTSATCQYGGAGGGGAGGYSGDNIGTAGNAPTAKYYENATASASNTGGSSRVDSYRIVGGTGGVGADGQAALVYGCGGNGGGGGGGGGACSTSSVSATMSVSVQSFVTYSYSINLYLRVYATGATSSFKSTGGAGGTGGAGAPGCIIVYYYDESLEEVE